MFEQLVEYRDSTDIALPRHRPGANGPCPPPPAIDFAPAPASKSGPHLPHLLFLVRGGQLSRYSTILVAYVHGLAHWSFLRAV